MKRHFPGLRGEVVGANDFPEGIFLVRVDRAYYRLHPQKPFFILSFTVLEPKDWASRKISGRLYCTEKSLWKLIGSCGISAMTPICSAETRWFKRPSSVSRAYSEPTASHSPSVVFSTSLPV